MKKTKTKIIAICGSLRFKDTMIIETERLELEGNCVLSVVYPSPNFDRNNYTPEQCVVLAEMHKMKIDLSDSIFVVNVGGYIGDSTKEDIAYAKKTGKEIIYLEEHK
ncbi:MAG: hypothetical protein FWB72_04215 [Firmicutes bacterium]|nr:hypothetical protein [Bacillota bacterium]